MALVEETLFGTVDKVQKAIDRLKAFEPQEGYYLAFSGGKDSQCIYHLAKMAGVKFDAHYSVTTVDPPELTRFIKYQYPDVIWDKHFDKEGKPMSMYRLISERTIPPTRTNRYCCAELKENGGKGRVCVTGVRWAESVRRKNLHGVVNVQTSSKKFINDKLENVPGAKLNSKGGVVFLDDNDETCQVVDQCYQKKRTKVNPIIDWEESDVWDFLNYVVEVPHCILYDSPYNFKRIGCVGCPLQGREGMLRDFEIWPQYKNLYIKAFEQMIKNHPGEIRVASGELAETNGGGVQPCMLDGSNGALDGTQFVNVERERERERENTGSSFQMVPSLGQLLKPMVGERLFYWWMWMHREAKAMYEHSPNVYITKIRK